MQIPKKIKQIPGYHPSRFWFQSSDLGPSSRKLLQRDPQSSRQAGYTCLSPSHFISPPLLPAWKEALIKPVNKPAPILNQGCRQRRDNLGSGEEGFSVNLWNPPSLSLRAACSPLNGEIEADSLCLNTSFAQNILIFLFECLIRFGGAAAAF